MDFQPIQEQLIVFLNIIVKLVLTYVSFKAVSFVGTLISKEKIKIQSIKDEEVRNKVNEALDRVESLLTTNITYAENVLKQDILDSIADGKVSKDELTKLKDTVVNNVIKQLSGYSVELLETELGDINSYLSAKSEEVLANLKLNENSSVNKTVIAATENK